MPTPSDCGRSSAGPIYRSPDPRSPPLPFADGRRWIHQKTAFQPENEGVPPGDPTPGGARSLRERQRPIKRCPRHHECECRKTAHRERTDCRLDPNGPRKSSHSWICPRVETRRTNRSRSAIRGYTAVLRLAGAREARPAIQRLRAGYAGFHRVRKCETGTPGRGPRPNPPGSCHR